MNINRPVLQCILILLLLLFIIYCLLLLLVLLLLLTDDLKIESVGHELEWLLIISNSRVLERLQ